MTAVMSLDEFRVHLADRLEIEPAVLAPDAALRSDVGLDSIQLIVMLMALEDLGLELPEALIPHIVSLNDAYAYYVNSQGHRA